MNQHVLKEGTLDDPAGPCVMMLYTESGAGRGTVRVECLGSASGASVAFFERDRENRRRGPFGPDRVPHGAVYEKSFQAIGAPRAPIEVEVSDASGYLIASGHFGTAAYADRNPQPHRAVRILADC